MGINSDAVRVFAIDATTLKIALIGKELGHFRELGGIGFLIIGCKFMPLIAFVDALLYTIHSNLFLPNLKPGLSNHGEGSLRFGAYVNQKL